MTAKERFRLDELLVTRGLYPSRSRARDAILRGTVTVCGRLATKPAALYAEDCELTIADAARAYVSRAALKLIHALDHFSIDVRNGVAVDIGASTGGFTQVLLERGALHVLAIDVGHGQFDPSLAKDSRIELLEGVNARDFDFAGRQPNIIVADVSFISLKLVLPNALAAAKPGARLIALIKPQFEAGRAALGKGGIVNDPAIHEAVCRDLSQWLETQMWKVLGLTPSPLPGGDGNIEFLIAAEKPC
jgi:23S rRNA (cytidine1920-2'-O)/16S rRNA (cytidine1409-2'-O)-methyltransferase